MYALKNKNGRDLARFLRPIKGNIQENPHVPHLDKKVNPLSAGGCRILTHQTFRKTDLVYRPE